MDQTMLLRGLAVSINQLAVDVADLPREETIELLSEKIYLGDRTLAEQDMKFKRFNIASM